MNNIVLFSFPPSSPQCKSCFSLISVLCIDWKHFRTARICFIWSLLVSSIA